MFNTLLIMYVLIGTWKAIDAWVKGPCVGLIVIKIDAENELDNEAIG